MPTKVEVVEFIEARRPTESPPRRPLIQAALDRMKKRKAEHTGCGGASSCSAMTAGAKKKKKKRKSSIKGKNGKKGHAESPNADSDGYKKILVNAHWRRIPSKNKSGSREEAATTGAAAKNTKQKPLRQQQKEKLERENQRSALAMHAWLTPPPKVEKDLIPSCEDEEEPKDDMVVAMSIYLEEKRRQARGVEKDVTLSQIM